LLQKEQVEFCKKHDIMLQAYSPLGNNNEGIPLLIEHPVVKEVAKEVDATPAQVLIAWAQVGGHCVLPKSVTPSRIASNLEKIAPLSDENVAKINRIGEEDPKRFNIPYSYRPQWDINVFGDEKEKNAKHQVKIQ
jgi:L-glyceraldehyde reductase